MKTPYRDPIEFISAYCDRWCERCAFTTRCSAFAVEVAIAMCSGDTRAGLELALGDSAPAIADERKITEGSGRDATLVESELSGLDSVGPRNGRFDGHPVLTAWLRVERLARGRLRKCDDEPDKRRTAEAFAVIRWDLTLIHAKLGRALSWHQASRRDERFGDHRIQNDWNGSAKVALISIQRSISAWQFVADAEMDAEAEVIVRELRAVEGEVLHCFPDVWRFRRPGFDDPSAVTVKA